MSGFTKRKRLGDDLREEDDTDAKIKKSDSAGKVRLNGKRNEKRKESSRSKKTSGCPLYSSKESVSALSLHLLAHPSDIIKDIAQLGDKSQTCVRIMHGWYTFGL